jgi:orotate phosphoribosyltransferase
MSTSKKIADHLLRIQAVKLSPDAPFTWASGILSPIYCDNRVVLSYPKVRKFVIKAFKKKAKKFEGVDVIAGVATAGIPHGALLAEAMGLPFIYIRSSAKSHGRQNLIEGELKSGQRVLVIEDLISTGGSCLKAVAAVREAGGEVAGVLAIFSYGFEEATTAFAAANCPFKTLSNYNILVKSAAKKGYIAPEAMETLEKWRENPKGWVIG